MKLETFFEKFEVLAEAPGAVAKMRALILRSAMLGRLSEPDSNDGLVEHLLQEVERDKARIGLERSSNSATANSDFLGEEIADEIPARWTWVRFGNIARHNAGKTLDMGRNRGQLRDYITTSNLYWGFFQLDAVRQMPIADEELERCTAVKGDLLICEGGEAGRAAVWPHHREIAFQNHIHRARLFSGINPFFVQRYFEKLNVTGEIEKYRKGVGISNMSGKVLASIPIPLPTVAEQSRIVAKVDELMALCDRLEAQQQERETRQTALARASLAQFGDAPTPANLQFLFHPSFTIPTNDLRRAIISLAVQGKLVPQDPIDEPAESVRHSALAEQAKSWPKRYEVPTGFSNTELPRLPEGWRWCRAEQICGYITKGTTPEKTKMQSGHGEVPFLKVYNLTFNGELDFETSPTFVSQAIHETELARSLVKPNDVLMNIVGPPLGKVSVVPALYPEWNVNQAIAIFRPLCCVTERYLCLCLLQVQTFSDLVGAQTRGSAGQDNMSLAQCRGLPIPLPPLSEQRRIVVRVDQLTDAADALELQLAASRTTAEKLFSALVAEFGAET